MQASQGSYYQATSGGNGDCFAARFTNSGNLQWSTFIGSGGTDKGYSITTDLSGNIFLCGVTQSVGFPLLNGGGFFQGTINSTSVPDAFLMKFDSLLALKWSTFYGGASSELMKGSQHLATDNCGNVYMAFETQSYDIYIRKSCDGGYIDSTLNSTDHIVCRFSNDGALHWSTFFGGDGVESAISLATDASGNLIAGGSWNFVSSPQSYPLIYPGTPSYFDPVFNGQHDGFIAKFRTLVNAGTQSFSYKSPVCTTNGLLSPTTSAAFVGGGTYSSSPGLVVSPITGVITVSASTPGSYVVNYSGGSCGCLTGPSLTATISISRSFSVSVSSGTACADNPAKLVATLNTTAAASFQWEAGESSDTVYVAPVSNTVYDVTVTVGGCTATAGGSISVTAPVAPKINFVYDDPLCTNNQEGLPRLLENFEKGGYFSAEGIALDPATGRIALDSVSSGSYLVTYSIGPRGCTTGGSSKYLVTINDPGILVTKPHVTMKPGESVALVVSGGTHSYMWTPSAGLSCTDCASPVASPPETTQYCVESFINSCYTATCILVEVLCGNGGNLTVPNAFTPNSDGRNESFCLQGWKRCNTFFNVMIFNRWGELMFESDDPDFCWDGNFNGVLLSSDVYVYVITASFNNEEKISRKGNITLVR